MRITKILCLFISFFILFCFLPALAQQDIPEVQHTPISSFEYGSVISIEAHLSKETEWVLFLYRHASIEEYQVRIMEKAENNLYRFDFDTSTIPELEFEYYLLAHFQDRDITSPPEAPENSYQVSSQTQESIPEIPSDFPPPEEEAKKIQLPVEVTGSLQIFLKKDSSGSQVDNSTANVRVFKTYNPGAYNINFDSNISFANPSAEGRNNLDLSNMMLAVTSGNHALRAGDIDISESEYTIFGLGRRGVDYSFNNQKTYVHVFNINAQESQGFSGFGIPRPRISILGGTVGQNLFDEALALKMIYVTGKDDPQRGINVGYSDFFNSRKGNVVSLVQEAKLFQNKMFLNAEIAHSTYDGNLGDEIKSNSDNAWKIGGSYTHGVLFLGANYNRIGKDFNSIGYQFFTNNRRGLQTNIGLNLGKVTISGGYNNSKDNVANDPSEYTTQSQDGTINIMWNISQKFALNVGYRRNNQDTSIGEGENIFNQDSLSNEFTSSLNMFLSEALSLNLSAVYSDLDSQNNPQNEISNLSLNLGGSYRLREILTVSPNLSFTETKYKFTQEKMQSFNSFLTSEIFVWPNILSLALTGSYMNSKSPGGDVNNLSFMGNVNFRLDKFQKFGNFILSLHGIYNKVTMPGYSDSTFSALLQLDFQF